MIAVMQKCYSLSVTFKISVNLLFLKKAEIVIVKTNLQIFLWMGHFPTGQSKD